MRNKDFLGSPPKAFPLEITILAVAELIETVEEIKKNIRNMDLWNLTFSS